MRNSLILALAVGVISIHSIACAGGSERLGTTGALELLIPMGARGVAMGGSIIAEDGGTESWFWNPAGAASIQKSEVSFSHRQYIADIGMGQFALAHNAGAAGVFGLSAKALTTDDELVRTIDQPDGTGESWAASFVVLGVSYARALTDRVSFGLSGHYLVEKVFNETAQGVAFDFGFLYRPTWENVTLGVVVKNYGPAMKFDGPDFDRPVEEGEGTGRSQSASFELPSFIQFGVAWDALRQNKHHWRVSGAFQSNNFTEDEYRVGTEWSVSNQLFLRGGYVASSLDQYMHGFSAGAGLRLPFGEREARLDYAWTDAGVFENNHLLSVTLAF